MRVYWLVGGALCLAIALASPVVPQEVSDPDPETTVAPEPGADTEPETDAKGSVGEDPLAEAEPDPSGETGTQDAVAGKGEMAVDDTSDGDATTDGDAKADEDATADEATQETSPPRPKASDGKHGRIFRVCLDETAAGVTSGSYIRDVSRCVYTRNQGGPGESAEAVRTALITDMHIKSASYAAINKAAFVASLIFGLMVVFWPTMSSMLKEREEDREKVLGELANDIATAETAGDEEEVTRLQATMDKIRGRRKYGLRPWRQLLFTAAGSQTSVTALAAVSFALYTHYKGQQSSMEDLMRFVLHSEDLTAETVDRVVAKLGEMDRGFRFNDVIPTGSTGAETPSAKDSLSGAEDPALRGIDSLSGGLMGR